MTQWLQITSGRGPEECCRVVYKVLQCIKEEAEKAGLVLRVLEAIPGELPRTFKSVLVALDGEDADASPFMAQWVGTVQWVGASPFRPHHKRRNWFVGVERIAVPDSPAWSPQDIKIETMRSSGPGGQHVNKSETAVRVTHVPTGTSAIAREERSQYLNRKLALARLDAVLEEQANKDAALTQKRKWDTHNQLERGNPVRVFAGVAFKPRALPAGEASEGQAVFVYGTLRKGFGNHDLIEHCELIGKGRTRELYALYAANRIPFAYRREQVSHITGEAYRVDGETLTNLDILEGHPEEYRREPAGIILEDGREITAWMYFHPEKQGTLVRSGNFAEHQ